MTKQKTENIVFLALTKIRKLFCPCQMLAAFLCRELFLISLKTRFICQNDLIQFSFY